MNEIASVAELVLATIQSSPYQPAGREKPDDLAEMVLSIHEHGILQPVVVRPVAAHLKMPGHWELIAGHRRVAAARIAGLDRIPARVIDASDEQAREMQLIENLQRADLLPMHEAMMLERLMSEESVTIEDAAMRIGKSPAYVRRRVSLLRAPSGVRKKIERGLISAAAVELVLAMADKTIQSEAWNEIDHIGLSVQGIREWVTRRTRSMDLERVPWKLDDETMAQPHAVSCAVCPYRIVAGHELFQRDDWGTASKAGRCSNSGCFAAKKETAFARRAIDLETAGFRKMTKAEQAKANSHGYFDASGFVRLDERASQDPKGRTWRKLLAESSAGGERVFAVQEDGIIELAPTEVAKAALKDLGIAARGRVDKMPNTQQEAEAKERKKRALDKQVAERVLIELMAEVQGSRVNPWRFVAERVTHDASHDQVKAVYLARMKALQDEAALALTKQKGKHGAPFDFRAALLKHAGTLNNDQQRMVLAVQVLAASAYDPLGDSLTEAARTFGIDLKAQRVAVEGRQKSLTVQKVIKKSKRTVKKGAAK